MAHYTKGMKGLIPEHLKRLQKVKVFTPNVHHQWQIEEDERALIEWARREEEQPKEGIYGLPSRWTDKKEPWYKKLTMLLP